MCDVMMSKLPPLVLSYYQMQPDTMLPRINAYTGLRWLLVNRMGAKLYSWTVLAVRFHAGHFAAHLLECLKWYMRINRRVPPASAPGSSRKISCLPLSLLHQQGPPSFSKITTIQCQCGRLRRPRIDDGTALGINFKQKEGPQVHLIIFLRLIRTECRSRDMPREHASTRRA